MPEPTPAALRLVGSLVLAVSGCAAQEQAPTAPPPHAPEPTTAATATPAAASFDLALVKAEFEEACADSRIDETFCEKVSIDGWKARGMTLVVPTGLAGAEEDTAKSFCRVIQDVRFDDPEGSRLGFRDIAILNRYGIDSATCWKPRF